MVPDAPTQGYRIDCIVPYDRGFVALGENGYIFPFEQSQNENQVYRQQQRPLMSENRVKPSDMEIPPATITSGILNSTDDVLFYID